MRGSYPNWYGDIIRNLPRICTDVEKYIDKKIKADKLAKKYKKENMEFKEQLEAIRKWRKPLGETKDLDYFVFIRDIELKKLDKILTNEVRND